MIKISWVNERGIGLMLALVAMVVLSIIGVGLVAIGIHETRFAVQERLSDATFYIADGGVEFAISQLKGNPNYRGPTTNSLGDGTYTVTVSTAGQPLNRYLITSVAHIPDAANPKATRRVETVVQRTPQQAAQAIRVAGGVWIFDPTTIKGNIHSNGYLWFNENTTVIPDDNNNGSVYTSAQEGWWGLDEMILIQAGKTLTVDSSQEVKSNSWIIQEDRIVGDPYIEEWSDVPELAFPSVDEGELLAGAVDMGTGDPPDPFIMEDGKVYNFRKDWGSLDFGVVGGEGTIVASNGVRVKFQDPVGDASNYLKMNVILVDAGIFDKVEFKKDTYIEGFISS
ncbi:MAG: pilus assembly PilX N-terminal domain-containing protein, partial [bacterium]